MLGPRSFLIALVLLTGCNGLSLRKADGSSLGESARSVLRLQSPGPFAQKYLEQQGLASSVAFDPAATAKKLTDQTSPEGRLVLAELCDLAGREAEFWSPSKSLNHYLDAAWYASQALFDPGEELPLERRGDALTVYNHAVERFLRRSPGRKLLPDAKWETQLASLNVNVAVRRDDAVWQPEPFDELKFARDYMAVGVPDRQREGLGVPLFAVRKRWWRDPERQTAPEKFFQPLQSYAVTAVLRFQPGDNSTRPAALLELHDPLRYDGVQIAGRNVLLAADTTIPLVYQVTNSDLDRITQVGLFDPQREEHKTGLYLTHPYERGKIPVVLIHGLWSSPKTWTRTINDLRADPTIRERYQFWTFQYPTGNPFIHSAAKLRQSLAELRSFYDPNNSDPAFDQMVFVGHSMGGLIAKTMIASSGDNVWKLISPRPFDELKAPEEDKELFRQTFFFEPVPSAKRVVFIAVPHRGSLLGNNWIGQVADRIIRRPNVVVKAHELLLQQNGNDFFTNSFDQGIPSSIRTLQLHSPLLQTVDHLAIESNVPRHSIIARVAPVPLPKSTDGVVPYDSSHLDGVVSEKVVTGSHTCLDQPDVIDELKRILYEHVEKGPPSPTPSH
jgi:pimeloyl-ACP methyl ester carboxylesterase